VVVNAIHDHTKFAETQLSGCHYRSGHPSFLGGYQDEPTLRARIGKIMGCSMQEIALTRNATMGMSYIAQGLELGAGDEVIMTDQEHAGGRSAYDVRVRRDGIKIVEVTMPSPANDPEALVQAFRAAITDSTKVLAIPHITSAFGTVLPVKRIIAAARARRPDLYVVLDGAQALGHVPVDVRDFDCDAYFSSPHKWVLSPKGTGVLYVRKATNRRVWTTVASSEWDFREDVGRRFTQIGTGNQSLNKGFEAALDFLERIGIATIHSRIKALGDRLRAGLARIDGVTVQSSTHAELCAGITNYKVPGWQAQDAVEHLYSTDRIMPRAVADGIRQSLHIYTTFEDVDRTLARIEKMKR
jgi:selenocysteine lyase/cysteine desulfurase